MKVAWTSTAVSRIEAIEDYIADDDPEAAVSFVSELLEKGESLSLHPQRGRFVPELPASGLRELLHGSYRIVYRVLPKQVQILTVFEGHRALRKSELDSE